MLSLEDNPKVYVVIPAYNEEKTLGQVLDELLRLPVQMVIVDDGSQDNTFHIAGEYSKKFSQIHLYQHLINLGLGAAIKTGIQAALILGADIIVTFDADGQHHAGDLLPLINPLLKGEAEAAIGIRDFQDMPRSKRLGNQIMNLITLIFYGIRVKDSQSGLRAFTSESARKLELHSRDYGISSEIIGEIRKKRIRMKEVPMKTIYTDYALSKGTNTKEGIKILFKLLRNVLK